MKFFILIIFSLFSLPCFSKTKCHLMSQLKISNNYGQSEYIIQICSKESQRIEIRTVLDGRMKKESISQRELNLLLRVHNEIINLSKLEKNKKHKCSSTVTLDYFAKEQKTAIFCHDTKSKLIERYYELFFSHHKI